MTLVIILLAIYPYNERLTQLYLRGATTLNGLLHARGQFKRKRFLIPRNSKCVWLNSETSMSIRRHCSC
jgi:hypothetical protein